MASVDRRMQKARSENRAGLRALGDACESLNGHVVGFDGYEIREPVTRVSHNAP